MQNTAMYLRRHAYELTGLAYVCTDPSAATELARYAVEALERAKYIDLNPDSPPLEV